MVPAVARFPLSQILNPMKTLLHDRNTARPLGGTAGSRETFGSVLPGSAIPANSGSHLHLRMQPAMGRTGAIRLC